MCSVNLSLCLAKYFQEKHYSVSVLSIISQHQKGTDCWNSSLWKTCSSDIVSTLLLMSSVHHNKYIFMIYYHFVTSVVLLCLNAIPSIWPYFSLILVTFMVHYHHNFRFIIYNTTMVIIYELSSAWLLFSFLSLCLYCHPRVACTHSDTWTKWLTLCSRQFHLMHFL